MRLLTVFFLFLFAINSFADVTITEESDGSRLVTYFARGISAHYIDDQVTNITDIKKGIITVLNPMGKTFFRATFAEMKGLANQMKSIEQNGGPQDYPKDTSKITVVSKGITKVAGYDCEQFELSQDGEQAATVCVSASVAKLITKEADFSSADNLMDALDSETGIDNLTEQISKIEKKGYLMQESVTMFGGYSTIVTSVSKEKISPEVFEVPADYQRITLGQAMGRY